MEKYHDFTNLFQLNKTLRFELKPIGKTSEHLLKGKDDKKDEDLFVEGSPLKMDKKRYDHFKDAKKRIDEEHKNFIDKTLSCFSFSDDLLEAFEQAFNEAATKRGTEQPDNAKKKLADIQTKMRAEISRAFKKIAGDKGKDNPEFNRLFSKELINNDLADDKDVSIFNKFTTYFSGFNTNRKNMYSEKEQSTAIAYRIVHDNLPIFIYNIKVYEEIREHISDEELAQIFSECKADAENKKKKVVANSLGEVFELSYINHTLTQNQIDFYNTLIGKIVKEDGSEVKGLNEHINLYNQQQKEKKAKLPLFTNLKKQILSDRVSLSWLPELFESDNDVIEAIKRFYIDNDFTANVLKPTKNLFTTLGDYDLNGIFIRNDNSLSTLSQRVYKGFDVTQERKMSDAKQDGYYSNYDLIEQALKADLIEKNPLKKKNQKINQDEIDKKAKAIKSLSIRSINELVEKYTISQKCSKENMPRKVEDYLFLMRKGDFNEKDNLIEYIEGKLKSAESVLRSDLSADNKNFLKSEDNSKPIKELFDATKQLQYFVKTLLGTGEEPERDMQFYGQLSPLWDKFVEFNLLYNKVRNWFTKKPFSQDKIRLCFDKATLLNGWVDNQTTSDLGAQAGGYLFRKKNEIGEYDYFLGISVYTKWLRNNRSSKGTYERLDYYQAKKQTIYGKSYKGENSFKDDKEQLKKAIINFIYRTETEEVIGLMKEGKTNFLTGDKVTPYAIILKYKAISPKGYKQLLKDKEFKKENINIIQSLQQTINEVRLDLTKVFTAKNYKVFTEIQDDIEILCKERIFEYFPVSDDDMTKAMINEEHPLYLFQISNKDLSFAKTSSANRRSKRGTENLHTLLFKALMGGGQEILDLGSGAVFFREKSLKKKATHPKNKEIERKNPSATGKVSKFSYDIYKDKRYTENKFLFHLSIVQNYKMSDNINISEFNQSAINYIRRSKDMHIIGIDRGERNLLYYSVIDMKGNIIEQKSLNIIKHEDLETDYHDLLHQREIKRKENRQNWEVPEAIKDLKKGYLSQAVYEITQLMMKYNAIIALEDLGQMFVTRGQKIEKAVYQQFEKSLADKLSYLVDKKKAIDEPGGVLNAYQLAVPLDKAKNLKQNGFLFYVPAWNTSKIDPVTGFVDLLRPKKMKIEDAQAYFKLFTNIRYNAEKDYFEFDTDLKKFETKNKGKKTQWTICTFGTRIKKKREGRNWKYSEVNLIEELKKLFSDFSIDYQGNKLKESIVKQESRKFFDQLIEKFQLTLQLRNSDDKGKDYIISPVADANGNFFKSKIDNNELPSDADANGAFNIARKGLMAIRQIKEAKEGSKPKLDLKNEKWLTFAQDKPYLK